MENAIMRILPALMNQPFGGFPIVVRETIAIKVAKIIDPGKSQLDVGPDGFYKIQVGRPNEVLSRQ